MYKSCGPPQLAHQLADVGRWILLRERALGAGATYLRLRKCHEALEPLDVLTAHLVVEHYPVSGLAAAPDLP